MNEIDQLYTKILIKIEIGIQLVNTDQVREIHYSQHKSLYIYIFILSVDVLELDILSRLSRNLAPLLLFFMLAYPG